VKKKEVRPIAPGVLQDHQGIAWTGRASEMLFLICSGLFHVSVLFLMCRIGGDLSNL
jgi:hypothetical protein